MIVPSVNSSVNTVFFLTNNGKVFKTAFLRSKRKSRPMTLIKRDRYLDFWLPLGKSLIVYHVKVDYFSVRNK